MVYRSILLAAVSLVATVALAQENIAASQPEGVRTGFGDDIIVTARRREEALQDVPISITAVSGDSLAQSGVNDAAALQTRIPSLSITTQGTTRSELGFAIRGQRAQESQLLTDMPVGVYFAEVVQARSVGLAYSLYDLQSVQVLKGVQGTLFGRNMTGGAVLIEPNTPSDQMEVEVRAQLGNYDMRDLYGMINAPIADGVALRVAGKVRQRDGFTTDVLTGRDYDDQNYETFRVSLKLNPTERLESTTIFDYIHTDEHGTALVGTHVDPNSQSFAGYGGLTAMGIPNSDPVGHFAAQQQRGRYKFASGSGTGGSWDAYGVQPYEKMKNWGITNRTTYDLDSVTFKNVFSYRKLTFDQLMDLDGTPSYLINSNRYRTIQQYSEEFQAQGQAFNDRLDYVLGVYYFLEKGTDGSTSSQFPELAIGFSDPPIPLDTPASLFLNRFHGEGRAETGAVYAAGTYSLSDRFKLSAGVRYTKDKREATVTGSYPNMGICIFTLADGTTPSLANCPQSNSESWDDITWDLTLQYEPSESLTTYVSTRRGFRAGGFSLRAVSTAELQPFHPETIQEYEAGLKTRHDLGVGILTTGLAVFYQDYKNVQKQHSSIDGAGNVTTIITNTAKQRNYGGEFEVALSAGGLNLSAFYSYVGIDITRGRQPGEFELVGAPHHQLGGNISYEMPLPADYGSILLNANISYASKRNLDKNDIPGQEPGYELINLRAGWNDIMGTGLGAAAFVNNLTKTYYRTGVIGIYNEAGYLASTYGEPRTYGLELSYRF